MNKAKKRTKIKEGIKLCTAKPDKGEVCAKPAVREVWPDDEERRQYLCDHHYQSFRAFYEEEKSRPPTRVL